MRSDSLEIIFKNSFNVCSSFFAPSNNVSAKPLIDVIGVFNSCDTLATNSLLKFSSFLRFVISCNTITIPYKFFFVLERIGTQDVSKYF